MARVLAPTDFDTLVKDLPDDRPLATFTKRLRSRIRDEEPVAFEGMDLPTTLEVLMKVARFRVEVAEPGLQAVALAGGDTAHELAIGMCDELLSLVVWLGRLQAPSWLMQRLFASEVFVTRAHTSEQVGDLAGAIHWYTGVLCVPATTLRAPSSSHPGVGRIAIERLLQLGLRAPEHPMRDALEAWNDLLSSYALYDERVPQTP